MKLDRGLPLVMLEDGTTLRAEHSSDLIKHGNDRVVIGDKVSVSIPHNHDVGIIEKIHPRVTEFIRKDPTERTLSQTLAANFDLVIISEPLSDLNCRRLERELVLAHQTRAKVAVLLTKSDLAEDEAAVKRAKDKVSSLAGDDVAVIAMAADDPKTIDEVRDLVAEETTAILLGKSGVGKSTLVNLLLGEERQATGEVREADGKGRHTTVSRQIIGLPNGGRIVDMPGVRGLGLWDAEDGIGIAFSDIEEIAKDCKFRDCKHENEPGCAVREALRDGVIDQQRFDSYVSLRKELDDMSDRRRRRSWQNKKR